MKHLNLVKQKFEQVANSQEEKGLKKYGKPLDPLDDYDWLEMALEESVDETKYLIAEMEKRKLIVLKIREAVDDIMNDPIRIKLEVNKLLDLLEGKK